MRQSRIIAYCRFVFAPRARVAKKPATRPDLRSKGPRGQVNSVIRRVPFFEIVAPHSRACFKIMGGPVFAQKGQAGEAQRSQRTFCAKTSSAFAEATADKPGGGSFLPVACWGVGLSRRAMELAALATAKIPSRRPAPNFKTGSQGSGFLGTFTQGVALGCNGSALWAWTPSRLRLRVLARPRRNPSEGWLPGRSRTRPFTFIRG